MFPCNGARETASARTSRGARACRTGAVESRAEGIARAQRDEERTGERIACTEGGPTLDPLCTSSLLEPTRDRQGTVLAELHARDREPRSERASCLRGARARDRACLVGGREDDGLGRGGRDVGVARTRRERRRADV